MADDVITLLHRQHAEIRTLFTELETATGDERKEAWYQLVRLLSIHETAEEEIVHPAVKRVDGGEPIVDARVAEEHRAKELLSTMDRIGPDAEGFDTLLVQLRDDVLAHAEHEEQTEFPLLREKYDQERLERMAKAVRAAEAIAPTRPHPGVESPIANMALGPVVAVVDKARDAIRKVLG
ncbi:Hemerythrin HHE cation binding domain-containing protein [Lentzea xinjiangensis]|uniref:Hemerythrin HHE cation binding domain-containing protein n=1 Tax=Lentzea xinjiangensis TaxID=402600 RepID=A0A1H9P8Z8_9PSEU|nr:hemerythrin domain-containing protein [Lentzea xinjiangensis]SER44678.1 Hemerythrin HHE cation binding domain-containing protein [Lentzea xinjiangensis]